jgi:hypothetical protein
MQNVESMNFIKQNGRRSLQWQRRSVLFATARENVQPATVVVADLVTCAKPVEIQRSVLAAKAKVL